MPVFRYYRHPLYKGMGKGVVLSEELSFTQAENGKDAVQRRWLPNES